MVNGIKIIRRKRIEKELENIFHYPLFVVHAPLGYGKTTEVRGFLKETKTKTIWVTLTENDTEIYFWERLTKQIERFNNEVGAKLEVLGFPQNASAEANIVDMVFNYEFNKPLVIVIDDYHLTDSRKIYKLLRLISQEHLEYLHIFVITRDLSDFESSIFYSKNLAYLMNKDTLRFTKEEMVQYLEAIPCKLLPKEIDAIYSYSDGWISMIYLLTRNIERGKAIGLTYTIEELVEHNLYETVDNRVKQVLLHLSSLEYFSPSMLMQILDGPDISEIWDRLLRENAFIIHHDFENNTYRVHNMLRDFLIERAKQCNIDFTNTWLRAGNWCIENNKIDIAFGYYYRAGHIEKILSILNKKNMPDLYYTQFQLVLEIFNDLDQIYWYKYPMAYLQYLRFFALNSKPGSEETCRSHLEKMIQHFEKAVIDEKYRNMILGEINIIYTFVVFNDCRKMVEHNQRALDLFSGGCSSIVTRKREITLGSPHLLYTFYKEKGSLYEITDFIVNNFRVLQLTANGCGTGSEEVAKAEYALETGDMSNIELYAYKALYRAQSYEQVNVSICAIFALGRFLIYEGRHDECRNLFESLQKEIVQENNPLLNTTFELCRTYVDIQLRCFDSIPPWIKNGDIESAPFYYNGLAYNHLIYGKILLAQCQYRKLDAIFEDLENYFSKYHNLLGFLHNYIHGAVAREHTQGKEAAKKVLCKALDIGAADNIIMPFVENAEYILPLIKEIKTQGKYNKDYIERITACSEKYLKNQPAHKIDVSLSTRELEVLQLLADGNKHMEISEQLFISMPTVRYHIKNIYLKLEVNNKVNAIRKAQKLKLI